MENQGEMFSDLALEKQYDNMVKELDMENKETLEEFINYTLRFNTIADKEVYSQLIRDGAKWQQERSYSKEEIFDLMNEYADDVMSGCNLRAKSWFNQFKKK